MLMMTVQKLHSNLRFDCEATGVMYSITKVHKSEQKIPVPILLPKKNNSIKKRHFDTFEFEIYYKKYVKFANEVSLFT